MAVCFAVSLAPGLSSCCLCRIAGTAYELSQAVFFVSKFGLPVGGLVSITPVKVVDGASLARLSTLRKRSESQCHP